MLGPVPGTQKGFARLGSGVPSKSYILAVWSEEVVQM